MTQKTQSETLFEQFCADVNIPCTPIPRSNGKTPDYDLTLGGNIVVAELKQCDPSEEDAANWERARSHRVGSAWAESGRRVRAKINTAASKQLKARSKGVLPTLLVVYDNGTFTGVDSNDFSTTTSQKIQSVLIGFVMIASAILLSTKSATRGTGFSAAANKQMHRNCGPGVF